MNYRTNLDCMDLTLRLLLITITACILASCKFHTRKHIGPHTDVYLAGNIVKYYSNEFHRHINTAVYWKNGVMTQLSDSLTDATVKGIAICGNDVYIVGDISQQVNPSYETALAVYWKNGVLTQLGQGSIEGIAFKGNDMYMVGESFGNGSSGAVYWKNGKAFSLGSGSLYSISIDGDHIYMAGCKNYTLIPPDGAYRTNVDAATYWKDDKVIILADATSVTTTRITSIDVHDGFVHCVGYENPYDPKPVYWQNQNRYSLTPRDSTRCNASAVTVDDDGNSVICGDMYLGRFKYQAVYWRHNTINILPHTGKGTSTSHCITTLGSDIYIGGNDGGNAAYWKNGRLIQVGNIRGDVQAIALVNY
ncbi:MAG TPA: hypothetical protein VHB54_05455 [Mucilaginibacter sp.]|nr:hypothetical protein [Mucilaginibacter sp.]